ncbi:MAG: patatin family protein [Erysipelotrichaceae bacterium]|nr:patatin family protein [Erysipelotrichaceae bacterium]
MYKTALVLEGGGLRGIFTAGVVDCLLDNKIFFDYVIGVSAGACNMFAYIGEQKRYIKKCMIQKNPFESFYGVPQAIESHRLVDLDKVFDEYTESYGFDFDRFISSRTKWEMVVSNMRTGQAEYLHSDDIERAKLIGKASCSLPIITPPVKIDDDMYLDGGILDSIPVQRALDLGYDRILVVLTRKKGNFSSLKEATKLIFSRLYADYPTFLEKAFQRGVKYREEVALCEKLEAEDKAIIIRPTMQEVGRLESDEDALSMSYYHGYTKTKEYIAQLKQWFV